jgi:hypothetical protein
MLAPALAAVALALFLLFGLGVFSQAFPLRLLAPAWQLRLSGALIERAPLALIGLVLLQLAAHLDPANRRLGARWEQLGRFGVIAVLGFLLLMPLQVVATARSIRGLQSNQRAEQVRVHRNLELLRQQINGAGSLADLQQRIQAIQAPDLIVDANSLNQPLPQLKQALLASVDQSQQQLNRQLGNRSPRPLWNLLQASGRGVLSSLVLAVAFAACTPTLGDPEWSLLMAWRRNLRWRRNLKPSGTSRSAGAISTADYFRSIHTDRDKPPS